MPPHLTAEAYLTVASILAGFGVTVLMFRIQRELQVEDDPDWTWLPWADWLIIGSTSLSLIGVVFPLTAAFDPEKLAYPLAAASCAAAALLLAAYPFAIIDHYRIVWGKSRWSKSMRNTIVEPGERIIVVAAFTLAGWAFLVVFFVRLSSH